MDPADDPYKGFGMDFKFSSTMMQLRQPWLTMIVDFSREGDSQCHGTSFRKKKADALTSAQTSTGPIDGFRYKLTSRMFITSHTSS